MTAREMFEELGYEYTYCGIPVFESIEYEKKEMIDGYTVYQIITFDFYDKTVKCDGHYESLQVGMPTFKAITKQLEELGWL
jgi:hypothetical protein